MPRLARYWIAAFVLLNLLMLPRSGPNPTSRLATMAALCRDGSFYIDDYVQGEPRWTEDWSRSPQSGHYYSNKAPGPMLLGAPVFCALDLAVSHGLPDGPERRGHQYDAKYLFSTVLALLFQILPFALFTALALQWLAARGASQRVQNLMALALLFGNTSSIFMNNWFGHAHTAACLLGMALALLEEKWLWMGLAFGLALLGDYSVALILPGLLWAAFERTRRDAPALKRRALLIVAGGLVPGFLWILYHVKSFGGPFAIPNKYENPIFLDQADKARNLWGVLALPDPLVVLELLVGPRRGLLFTQPWVLAAAAWLAASWRALDRDLRTLARLLLPSLPLLILMNASFGGWHGGGSSGPRYISPILPLFALPGALLLIRRPALTRAATVLVGLSALFTALIFSTSILFGTTPLWTSALAHARGHLATALLRLSLIALVSGVCAFKYLRGARSRA